MAPWLLALLVGAGIGGAVLIVKYWREIKQWLAGFLPKVSNFIREVGRRIGGIFEYAASVVADKLDDMTTSIKHSLYFKEADGTWTERITERKGLPESELPPEIKARLQRKRHADISDYVEDEMQLSLS